MLDVSLLRGEKLCLNLVIVNYLEFLVVVVVLDHEHSCKGLDTNQDANSKRKLLSAVHRAGGVVDDWSEDKVGGQLAVLVVVETDQSLLFLETFISRRRYDFDPLKDLVFSRNRGIAYLTIVFWTYTGGGGVKLYRVIVITTSMKRVKNMIESPATFTFT